MPPEESERSILAVHLSFERQLHAAYRWQYEWVLLFLVGISALTTVTVVIGTGIELITLLGIVVLIVSGYGLAAGVDGGFTS
jgi:hypothetical protein